MATMSKHQLQKNIWEYERRLREYKKKGWSIRKLNRKVKDMSKRLAKMQLNQKDLDSIHKKILNFSGVDVKNCMKSKYFNRYYLTIFCKFSLEKKIPAKMVAEFIGTTRQKTPSELRKELIKEIDRDLDKKVTYFRFKQTLYG